MDFKGCKRKWRLMVGICVVLGLALSAEAKSSCKLKAKFNLNGYKNVEKKTVVVGGMFPVHKRLASSDINTTSIPVSSACDGFNFRTFRWAQTMLFAIDEINLRSDLLPETDLGYVIYDSCFTISKAVEGTLTYLTGQDEAVPNYRCGTGSPLAALVGAGASDLSIATARILGLYYFPQVSYASSCSVLQSKFQFPTFLRTIPSDDHQSQAMAQLVLRFGWTWVGTIAADDDYGKYGIKKFMEVVEEAGVCISFSETLPKVRSPDDIHRIVQTVIRSTANIIVVFSSDVDLSPLLDELLQYNVTNRTWIASEAWITSALISRHPGVQQVLSGTLGFGLRRADIPNLQDHLLGIDPYLDPLTEEFWETAFNCTLSYSRALLNARAQAAQDGGNATASRAAAAGVPAGMCTGKESLMSLNNTYTDVSQLRLTYSVYKAVYAVANALHNMESCTPGEGPFEKGGCANISNFEPWQLMYYLKNVKFNVPHTGETVYFNDGDVDGWYDILNWQRSPSGEISYIKIGHYNSTAPPESRMTINNASILWNNAALKMPRSVCSETCQPGTRKGIRQGEPVCCFDCIPCADGEISNTSDARACIQCPSEYWSNANRDTCVPKTIEFLDFAEPLGITLIAIAAFGALVTIAVAVVFLIHINTPMVKVNDALLSFLLLFSLVVTFLCSIVFLGEPKPWSCMTSQVALALGFALCLSCIMGKSALLMLRARAIKSVKSAAKSAAKAAAKAEQDPDAPPPPPAPAPAAPKTYEDSLKPGHQKAMALVCTLIQAVACTVWLCLLPPRPNKNMTAQNIKIILECDPGNVVFISCIFAYDILLALLAFVFAFTARKLEDHFSEGKSITFGMLVFFIVWISFVPAYLSTRGKFMVAVQIFAILASSFGLLACIFLPKCYVLLVKPERNTDEQMRPRQKGKDNSAVGTSLSLASSTASEANGTIVSTVSVD
ncbi:vomeronasal type-2 receptor 1 [Denticeps clupeoides]|uniref:G-protein coupled receptors family 3 profile domain-containing protein n=1 Tax=Denticeps clupeoides TaxID=299321 RepID=A0AAY4DHZ1_9TELE|nr:vomeronasal type-2 receptor 1-like [Denticeps clupeoides]